MKPWASRATSTVAEIRSAYRKLAARYHPDVNPDSHEAEEKFKEINEAHEVLSTPEKRQVYDQYGHDGSAARLWRMGEGGFGDIFDMFFGGGGLGGQAVSGERARQQATQGSDLRFDLEITLEDAAFGVHKTLRLSRQETATPARARGPSPARRPRPARPAPAAARCAMCRTPFSAPLRRSRPASGARGEGRIIPHPCPVCRGQGRVRQTVEHPIDIPPGVDSGTRLVDPGQGDAGLRGGPRGALYVIMYVQPHPQFTRRGMDVLHEATVTFAQAALGDTLEVPVLGGSEKLTIPEGTQPGTTFRLRGKGFPDVNCPQPGARRSDRSHQAQSPVPAERRAAALDQGTGGGFRRDFASGRARLFRQA